MAHRSSGLRKLASRVARLVKEPIDSPISGWRPISDPPQHWRVVLGTVLIASTAGVVLWDILCSGFSKWSSGHPWVVEVATGATLIAFTVLVVDHLIHVRDARRWRAPSLLAIDAYLYPADRASKRIYDRIKAEVESLESPPVGNWTFRMREALDLLVVQQPSRLGTLSDYVRKETDELALIAMQVSTTLARNPAFSTAVDRVFNEQGRLAEVAQIFSALHFMAGGLQGPNKSSVRKLVDKNIERVDLLLQAFWDELANLRLAVGEEEIPSVE